MLDVAIFKGSGDDPGGIKQFLMSYYPVHLQDEVIGVGIVVVEITEQKRREQAHSDLTHASRIIAVADVVEAISSHRPYRPGRGISLALRELSEGRGTLFDPAVVDACTQLHAQGLLALADAH